MHKLNFCKSLCLPKPFQGYDCFGLDIIHEFPEAVLVPMAGIATPAHILYASRPVMYKNGEAQILQTQELDSKKKLDALCSDPEAILLAPDHALDLDPRADIVFENRENSIKHVIERLFSAGYQRVAIWANNGIGRDAHAEEDGVVRTDDGIAAETRLNGKVQPFYQRGIPESYQNTAHQHIHIAPVTKKMFSFDGVLLNALEALHDWQEFKTLEEQRNTVRENTVREHLPGMSLCILDSEQDKLSEPLLFTHYPASANVLFPQYVMSGLIRTIIVNCTKRHQGLDMNNPETKKEHIQETKEYYQELLNS